MKTCVVAKQIDTVADRRRQQRGVADRIILQIERARTSDWPTQIEGTCHVMIVRNHIGRTAQHNCICQD